MSESENVTTFAEKLRNGEAKIGVVGLGYIGFSTAVYYARKGIQVVGYDVDKEKIFKFNAGENYIDNIQFWVGFDFRHLVNAELASASSDPASLSNVDAIFVSIPTERNGDPYMDILADTVAMLAKTAKKGAVVIVESTLTPGTAEKLVINAFKALERSDIHAAVAPRRDWFVDSGRNLMDIPRVVGGATPEATRMAAEVLGIVCNTVLPATSHREAELIKSVENAYRHMDIVLANQLAFAYSDVDIREVLQLVGTKWNMNVYYPNLGVGGYCIAPASKYVQAGTHEKIPLLAEATRFTEDMTAEYAKLMVGYERIVVLGISYKGGLKVHVLSPGLRLANELVKLGKTPMVNDPMYTVTEAMALLPKCAFDSFPEALKKGTLVVIAADHPEYVVPTARLTERLEPGVTVLDIYGVWKHLDIEKHVRGSKYILLGSKNWRERLAGK